MTSVVVISAGTGVPSSTRMLGDAISKSIANQLPGTQITAVELRDHAVSIAHAMTGGFTNPELSEVVRQVEGADIIVAVTPVFKASMSGLFKSFFDILDNNAVEGKTVILGATGGSSRHSLVIDMAMRPLLAYLRANVVPTGIYAAPEDWSDGYLMKRIDDAAKEAINAGRIESRRADKAMESLPFEEMLASISGGRA